MISKLIEGFTRICGKSQGYDGLAVRDELIHCSVNGTDTPCYVTAWEPTPAELAALNAGKPVCIRLLGARFPATVIPMAVFVEVE